MKLLQLFGFLLALGLCVAKSTASSEEIGDSKDLGKETNEVKGKIKDKRNDSSSSSEESQENISHSRVRRSLQVEPRALIHPKSLKRVVRSVGLINVYPIFEATVISNCKIAGHQDIANGLQDTYDDMKTCVRNKQIYSIPKDEYITHLEKCTEKAVRQTKSCLPDDQKYFPDLVFDMTRSLAAFFYDDYEIMRGNMAACLQKFNDQKVQRSYIQCLTDIAVQGQDSSQIPPSKAEFCQKFVPASGCFSGMIKEHCDNTSEIVKYREDYMNAIGSPCS